MEQSSSEFSGSPSKKAKGKRQSLTNIFPELRIHTSPTRQPHSTSSPSASPTKSPTKSLAKTIPKLKASMRKGWPRWLSIRGNSGEEVDLTIRIADYLREEANNNDFSEDPATIIQTVKNKSGRFGKETAALWAKIEDNLVELVYGSNYIETLGSDFDITEKLCRRIFRGEEVKAYVEARSAEYEAARAALLALKRPSTFDDVVRSRQEVINHAHALNYAIDHVVLDGQQITENFLKEVHRKLCFGGVLGEDAGSPGDYRTWEIAARHGKDMRSKSIFIRASVVEDYMKAFVEDLTNDMILAEESKTVDPFDMANRYCHRLVCIHPFGDGNGRMCRILLNVLLLKYAGHVSTFGGSDNEREEYLDLARRGNKKFHEEDMEVAEEEKRGHRELARFTLRKCKGTLEHLWAWVSKDETKQ
ncbi:fido domain-containing protein [Annulohypoxylon truncatum]|uniref:fido domain-containing protein n=1 Tax=Annulohypoxylon truncatum TaxID=327061 RepID=UPI0020085A5B|nr:fido domain-containing protein [Annulohypoxylon truncatum]KAI1213154.1 fido domain-containing protein [Annulohypoxylon truncatum]